jgi:hypothetical protein
VKASITLTVPGNLAGSLAAIRAAGFADSDDDATRVSIAALANWVGHSSKGAHHMPTPPVPARGTERTSVSRALEFVRAGRCICGANKGRHQVVLALLTLLAKSHRVLYAEVLSEAKALAERYNKDHGLPPSAAPASVAFTPAAMSQNWIRGYLMTGAGAYKERYGGPPVATYARRTSAGVEIVLLRSLRKEAGA